MIIAAIAFGFVLGWVCVAINNEIGLIVGTVFGLFLDALMRANDDFPGGHPFS